MNGRYASDSRRRSLRLRGYDYTQGGAYFVTIVVQGRQCLFGDVVDGEMRLNDAGEMVHRLWEELPGRFPSIIMDTFVVMPNHIHGIIILDNPVGPRDRPVGVPLVGTQGPGTRATADTDTGVDTDGGPVGVPLVGAQDPGTRATADTDTGVDTDGRPVGVPLVGTQGPGTRATADTDTGADTDGSPGTRANKDTRATTRVAPTGGRGFGLGNVVGAYKSLTTVEYARGVKAMNWPPFHGRLWQRNYYEHIVRSQEDLERVRRYILDNPPQWPFDSENPMAVSQKPEGI